MKKPNTTKIITLLVLALLLAACGGQPAPPAAEEEAGLPDSDSPDDGYIDDITPTLPYEIALREKLDDAIMGKFGYDEIRVKRSMGGESFSIKYKLKNIPGGSAFYVEMEELFDNVFGFDNYLFGEHPSLGDWYEWNDDDPEQMSVQFTYDGMGYYWLVDLDGDYLVFSYI